MFLFLLFIWMLPSSKDTIIHVYVYRQNTTNSMNTENNLNTQQKKTSTMV